MSFIYGVSVCCTKMEIKFNLFSVIWKISMLFKRLYRLQKRFFCIILILTVTVIIYYLITLKSNTLSHKRNTHTYDRLEQILVEENILEDKGTGCEMPQLNPFSDDTMQYNRDAPKVVCEGTDWVECHLSKCYVVNEILNQMNDVVCTYKDIVYENDMHYYIAEPVKVYGSDNYNLSKSDHVKVSCTGIDKNGLGILSSRWFGYKAGLRPVPERKSPEGRENAISIMILCFDSTSRNAFLRKMPKSYKVLTNELNATIFKSYNIVGEGTLNALYPLLTGLDLPDWKTVPKDEYLNLEAFLFHHMKEDGYRTAYLEDMPWLGTFQRRNRGFERRPTDYYLRAMLVEETGNGFKWWHGLKGRYCIGSIPQYGLLLNLTKQFLELEGKRFCLTFIADISHDDINVLSIADDDVVMFLRHFKERGLMKDTLLIVMGDHGTKYDAARKTYQGRIEERLPFMAITLPDNLIRARADALPNLIANSEVLTTHYDMHTTLLDAIGLNKYANGYHIPGADLPRGMSFLEPIPKSRSCSEAGIKPYWCACAKWQNVSETDPIYHQAANVLADYIDKITSDTRQLCAKRRLVSTEWVMRRLPNSEISLRQKVRTGFFPRTLSKGEHEYYQVKITMSPGQAIYEASMNYNVKEDYFFIIEKEISRITAYGYEPHCLDGTRPDLDKYCFCKDLLKTPMN